MRHFCVTNIWQHVTKNIDDVRRGLGIATICKNSNDVGGGIALANISIYCNDSYIVWFKCTYLDYIAMSHDHVIATWRLVIHCLAY